MKKVAVIAFLGVIFLTIAAIVWHNELVYSLPTPVPANYKAVNAGVAIHIDNKVQHAGAKPLFLHFFNPDCPCSKFNMPHFRSLAKQYGKEADFAIVVMSGKKFTQEEIQHRFDLTMPVYFDSAIAASCGVYSTPQAVIIDAHQQLYYRGNYNKSRYCTDKKSNYAQMALEGLLHKQAIAFDQYALTPYGCQLPTCTR